MFTLVTKDGEKHGIKLLAFDTMPYGYYQKQSCPAPYTERRNVLEKLFRNLQYIEVVPSLYSGNDTNKIYEFLKRARENGEEGIRLARKEMPDIIISDIMMPGMDGFALAEIVRNSLNIQTPTAQKSTKTQENGLDFLPSSCPPRKPHTWDPQEHIPRRRHQK